MYWFIDTSCSIEKSIHIDTIFQHLSGGNDSNAYHERKGRGSVSGGGGRFGGSDGR